MRKHHRPPTTLLTSPTQISDHADQNTTSMHIYSSSIACTSLKLSSLPVNETESHHAHPSLHSDITTLILHFTRISSRSSFTSLRYHHLHTASPSPLLLSPIHTWYQTAPVNLILAKGEIMAYHNSLLPTRACHRSVVRGALLLIYGM